MTAKLKFGSNRAFGLTEVRLPQPIANNCNCVLPGFTIVMRRNHSAHLGSYAKYLKVVAGYGLLHQPFWFGVVNRNRNRCGCLIRHQVGEPFGALLHFLVDRIRSASAEVIRISAGVNCTEQGSRISYGKHAEQNCVCDAKYGEICSDPES